MLTGRTLTPEHMDDPNATREDLAVALRFLRAVNARLGGVNAVLRQFRSWARRWPEMGREQPVRVLDLGAGSADIPLALARWARADGRRFMITAVDQHPVTCALAREYLHEHGGEAVRDIEIIEHDALRLTDCFNAGTFDYAHAGLFLHHLNDIQAMTALRIMDRLATRGMIWNDLVRVRFPRLLLCPLLIGAPPMIRHDAIVSVQAGFRRHEAIELASRAGWSSMRWKRHLVHRFTLVCDKPVS